MPGNLSKLLREVITVNVSTRARQITQNSFTEALYEVKEVRRQLIFLLTPNYNIPQLLGSNEC